MLARLFNNLSVQSLALSLLASVIWVGSGVFMGSYHYATLQLPGLSIPVSPLLFQLSTVILLPLYALWFNGELLRLGFLRGHYYLVPFLAVQFFLFGAQSNQPEVLLALPVCILLLRNLYRLIYSTEVLHALFNLGLLTGIGMLFFPAIGLFLPLGWIALMIFGHLNLRTLFIPVLGISATYFILFSLFFFLSDHDLTVYTIRQYSGFEGAWSKIKWSEVFAFAPIGITVLAGLAENLRAINNLKVQRRQFLNFNTALLIIALVALVLSANYFNSKILLAFPVALVQVKLVHYIAKAWLKDLVYLAVLASFVLTVF